MKIRLGSTMLVISIIGFILSSSISVGRPERPERGWGLGRICVESLFPLQNKKFLVRAFFLQDTYFLRYFDVLN